MKIRIGIYQFEIVWENIKANQVQIEKLLDGLKETPEILFLPEMYSTGFHLNPEKFNSNLLTDQINWQNNIYRKYNTILMGSMIYKDKKSYYNRIVIPSDINSVDYYDKRHLFKMEKENNQYSFGTKQTIFKIKSIKIMPQVCYDLRFPVWVRNVFGYHILFYSANWPAERQMVWETLLKARAIENYCYTLGVNRIGTDGNNISYEGGSAIYGPQGDTFLLLGNREEYKEVVLSINDLIDYREEYSAYKDADNFKIKNRKQAPPGMRW